MSHPDADSLCRTPELADCLPYGCVQEYVHSNEEIPAVKKIALWLGLPLLVLAAIMLWRAELKFKDPKHNGFTDTDPPVIDVAAAAERLSKAIGIPTISFDDRTNFDAGAFRDFHDFLQAAYPRVHSAMQRHVINDYSLVFHLPGSDPERLPVLFVGHFDVVPIEAASSDQWRFDPFSGTLAQDQIWGRGSLDDKLGVIGLLEAMEQLLASGFQPARSVYLAFGHDEEVGGLDGAKQVARWFEPRNVRFEFVLDEGGVVTNGIFKGIDQPVAVIGVSEKGWINLELTARAPGGHSSQPPDHTAVGILSAAIVRLEQSPFPATLDFTRMTIDELGHALPFSLRFLFANDWLLEPLIIGNMLNDPGDAAGLRTTTAATMFTGSPKSNILPTLARAVVNFRIIPGETADSVEARARQIIDDPLVEIVPMTSWDPSPVSPVDSDPYRLIASTIRAIDPDILVAPYVVRGGTDARYFYGLSPNVYRFLMARINPETIEQVHGINERVTLLNLQEAIGFYHLLIRRATVE